MRAPRAASLEPLCPAPELARAWGQGSGPTTDPAAKRGPDVDLAVLQQPDTSTALRVSRTVRCVSAPTSGESAGEAGEGRASRYGHAADWWQFWWHLAVAVHRRPMKAIETLGEPM